MEKQIALPDTYAAYGNLKNVLNNQGIVVDSVDKVLGFSVQDVRLLDVFFIGPFLIYVGMNKQLSLPTRVALVTLGVSTILYNGNNYLKNK